MPVNKDSQYSDVESIIYTFITTEMKYNTAVACGILANIEAESGFRPNVVNEIGAYGLCQWSYSRKTALFNYADTKSPSVIQQMRFVQHELATTESNVKSALDKISNTSSGAHEAARIFSEKFERHHRGPSEEDSRRAVIARDVYWSYYSLNPVESPVMFVPDLGSKIVEVARDQKGKSYKAGSDGPDTFDSAGLIYYSYNTAGKSIPSRTATGYYTEYKVHGTSIPLDRASAGDLLFYESELSRYTSIDYIAIANGSGGRIYVSSVSKEVVEDDTLGVPDHIFRVVSAIETSQSSTVSPGTEPAVGINPTDYVAMTSSDPTSMNVASNLSRMTAEGYDYGYLIDMTHGGEFKFYIPEFTEQAGANWSPVELRGRSVTVQAYDSTNSRNITVSLDLYAGVGVYTALSGESGDDTVSRMHSDLNFVKSLEYPDYSVVIARPPSTVQLILGAAVNIVGVVSNVVVEHLKPLDSQNRSMYAKLSFTVTQIETNPPGWDAIRSGQTSMSSTVDTSSQTAGLGQNLLNNGIGILTGTNYNESLNYE